jgi:hypothetical protein
MTASRLIRGVYIGFGSHSPLTNTLFYMRGIFVTADLVNEYVNKLHAIFVYTLIHK